MKKVILSLLVVGMGSVGTLSAEDSELSCSEKLKILNKQIEISTRICAIQSSGHKNLKKCVEKVRKNRVKDCKTLKNNNKISYSRQDGHLILSIGETYYIKIRNSGRYLLEDDNFSPCSSFNRFICLFKET